LHDQSNLKSSGKKRHSGVDVEIIDDPKLIPPLPFKLTLAVAFPKMNERSDWLIEKA
jgi:16S rRNA U1498 N3-methylase RsmE